MTPEAPLEIRLFGSLEVSVHGARIDSPRIRKAILLLAYLALRPGTGVDRRILAGTFWPESADDLALYNLRRYLTILRDHLGPEAYRIQSPSSRSLALNMDGAYVDAAVFDTAIRHGDIDSAMGIYRGPLLESCLDDWALDERAQREQDLLACLERAALSSALAGDVPRAVTFWRQALRLDPLRESTLRGLMDALRSGGDYAEVTRVYREFRLKLREEMNAEPGPETIQLYQSIRDTSRVRATACQPRSQADFARAKRLPSAPSSIIGRQAELERIRRELDSSRAVTLTGPGGVGKSRLALQIAEEAADDSPGDVWFVELGAVADDAHVPQVVTEVLGLQEHAGATLESTIAEHVGVRNALLILDTCEHVVEAAARLSGILLRKCPNIRILATSRQRLGISGEIAWSVPSLSLPDMAELYRAGRSALDVVGDSDAVRLFVSRARASHQSFELTETNARVIAEICRKLDGIPLALELAAARVRGLAPVQLLERLHSVFDILTSGDRSALPRQQTLRASMDWSYNLLSPLEQRVFRRLSVFAGGFDLPGATAICCDHDDAKSIESAIFELVDRSLVALHMFSDSPRYVMLDTVRQYARELLIDSQELDSLSGRHLQHYRALAEIIEPDLHGPNQKAAMERLDQEMDNLRAALAFSVANSEFRGDGLALAADLGRYWANRGYFGEAAGYLAELLDVTKGHKSAARVRALAAAGMMRMRLGDFEASRLFHEESLKLARDLGDDKSIWSALMRMGQAAYAQMDFTSAKVFHAEALEVASAQQNRGGMAAVHDLYGIVLRHNGELTAAKTHFEQCLRISRELGNPRGIADALYGLGMIAHYSGDEAVSMSQLTESLQIHLETGVRIGIYLALYGLAAIHHAQNRSELAAEMVGSAEALRESIDLIAPEPSVIEHSRITLGIKDALGVSAFSAAAQRGRSKAPSAFLN